MIGDRRYMQFTVVVYFKSNRVIRKLKSQMVLLGIETKRDIGSSFIKRNINNIIRCSLSFELSLIFTTEITTTHGITFLIV